MTPFFEFSSKLFLSSNVRGCENLHNHALHSSPILPFASVQSRSGGRTSLNFNAPFTVPPNDECPLLSLLSHDYCCRQSLFKSFLSPSLPPFAFDVVVVQPFSLSLPPWNKMQICTHTVSITLKLKGKHAELGEEKIPDTEYSTPS